MIDQSKPLETSSPTAPNYQKPPITIDKPSPKIHPPTIVPLPSASAESSRLAACKILAVTKRDRKLVFAGPGQTSVEASTFPEETGPWFSHSSLREDTSVREKERHDWYLPGRERRIEKLGWSERGKEELQREREGEGDPINDDGKTTDIGRQWVGQKRVKGSPASDRTGCRRSERDRERKAQRKSVRGVSY